MDVRERKEVRARERERERERDCVWDKKCVRESMMRAIEISALPHL